MRFPAALPGPSTGIDTHAWGRRRSDGALTLTPASRKNVRACNHACNRVCRCACTDLSDRPGWAYRFTRSKEPRVLAMTRTARHTQAAAFAALTGGDPGSQTITHDRPRVCERALAPTPDAAGTARRFTRDTLRQW